MSIELAYREGKVVIGAVGPLGQIVARAEGDRLDDTVKDLISQFADMQKGTIDALNSSGIIRYVQRDSEDVS